MLKTSLKLLKKLESSGFQAYIVGGFVRDYILGMSSLDVDITTNAKPQELLKIFEEGLLPNENYGAITVYSHGKRFEITTFRREIKYHNNRIPVEIEYIDDLVEDLKRRDFTINTLCIDSKGSILDLLNGMEDIDNKIIKTVGNAYDKFEQDSLRILRAVRFATSLNFKLCDEVKKAIIDTKQNLVGLSYERKRQELDKIFSNPNASYGVSLLLELGLDKELELYNLEKIVFKSDLLGAWSSIDVSDRYNFTKHEKEIIKNIKSVVKTGISRKTLYKYGLYINQVAADILGKDRLAITEKYSSLPIYSKRDINIKGNEILEVVDSKLKIAMIFTDIEDKILKGNLENDNRVIIDYIKKNY